MKRGRDRKIWGRVFYRYLISYLIVFLIPMGVFGTLVYYDFVRVLRTELIQHNTVVLNQAMKQIEYRMAEIVRLAHEVGRSSKFLPLYLTRNPYHRLRALESLKAKRDSSTFVYDVLYHPRGTDLVIGADSTYRLDAISSSVYEFAEWNQSDIEALFSSVSTPTVRPAEEVLEIQVGTGRRIRALALAYPVPLGMQVPYGTLLVIVREDRLMDEASREAIPTRSKSIILDDQNRVLAAQGISASAAHDLARALAGSETARVASTDTLDTNARALERNGSLVIEVESEATGWRYVGIVPTEWVLHQVQATRSKILAGITVILVTVAAAIWGFMRLNYAPLVDLRNRVEKKLHARLDSTDGVGAIGDLFTDLVDEKEVLAGEAAQAARLRRSEILVRLLSGDVATLDELDRLGLALPNGFYAVSSVHVLGVPEASRDHLRAYLQERLSNGVVRAYGVPALEHPYLTFLLISTSIDAIAGRVALVPEIVRPFSPESTVVGVGSTYNDPLKISRSFLQSLSAQQLRRVGKADPVVLFDTHGESPNAEGYRELRACVSRFSAELALHSRNTTILHNALDDIWSSLVDLGATVLMARHVYADVVAELVSAASDTPSASAVQELPSLDDIYGFEHDAEFFALRATLRRAVDQLAAHAAMTGDVARVSEYIRKNCSDPNLSVEQIADAVNLSYHYLSHMFRERTGRTVVDEIATIRIERFKELASTSDLPIAQLCTEVGYRGAQQFGRVFKKHEGLTPGQYRALARQ